MANLQIRVDDELRDRAQEVAQGMGLDLASAVRVFLTQMVRCNGMPFRLTADPFYSEANQAHLKKLIADVEAGRNIVCRDLLDDEA